MVQGVFQRRKSLLAPVGLQLTFPHRDAVPPHMCQFLLHSLVALLVAHYFGRPEFNIAFRHLEIPAAFMSVPEAAVHKDTCTILAQHNVGMSRQPRMIQPVSESSRKQILPDYHLRLCVSRMYGRHIFVPLFLSASVHPPPFSSTVRSCFVWQNAVNLQHAVMTCTFFLSLLV